jgi:hypothetical protein
MKREVRISKTVWALSPLNDRLIDQKPLLLLVCMKLVYYPPTNWQMFALILSLPLATYIHG